MSIGGKNTASSSVEHVVQVKIKRLLFLVTSVTPISTQNDIVWTAASHRAERQSYLEKS